jgi:hypothetical protein
MNELLLAFLVAACGAFAWLDIRGIPLFATLSRLMLAWRVRRNLTVSWKSAWRITGGRP